MEARIRQLEAMLTDVEIVDAAAGPDGEVSTGVVVSLRYVGDDDVERYLIGSIEERTEEASPSFPPNSPLGQALMGKKAGGSGLLRRPERPPRGRDRRGRSLTAGSRR